MNDKEIPPTICRRDFCFNFKPYADDLPIAKLLGSTVVAIYR
jgi:hypothetical protein